MPRRDGIAQPAAPAALIQRRHVGAQIVSQRILRITAKAADVDRLLQIQQSAGQGARLADQRLMRGFIASSSSSASSSTGCASQARS